MYGSSKTKPTTAKLSQPLTQQTTDGGGAATAMELCGHGDGNTGDAVRDETAYRALLASQRGRGGAVGPRRSYCSGVAGARCELGRQWRRRSCAAAAAVAATMLRESEGGSRRWTEGVERSRASACLS